MAHAGRLFEPGFTTKPVIGRNGHGLGLALVQQVIQRRGGEVSVANESGAVFTVRLPLANRGSVAPPTAAHPADDQPAIPISSPGSAR